MSEGELWLHTVTQVAVVGNASSAERIRGSKKARQALGYRGLKKLTPARRRRQIHGMLRECGVRYAGRELAKCQKTTALAADLEFFEGYGGGPKRYFMDVAALPTDAERIRRVIRDLAFIKEKGARDLLAELGIVTEMIAIDVRIINVLEHFGAKIPKNVQTEPVTYQALQDELIERVCEPLGITGVVLDRILYQNYDEILERNKPKDLKDPCYESPPTG